MKYDLIPEEERKQILDNIKKAFPDGAKDANDFKIMFNVMRGFLVIKGTQHIDDEHSGKGKIENPDQGAQFKRPEGDRADQNYGGKNANTRAPEQEEQQHAITENDRKPSEPSEMMKDHGHDKNPQSDESKGEEAPTFLTQKDPTTNREKSKAHANQSFVASLSNLLTKKQLRITIYIFLGFCIVFGFYLLSRRGQTESDYFLVDDEI